MSRKKWIVSKFDKERCAEIAEEYEIPPFAALIATSKGITDDYELEEFFSRETIYMSDPFELPDMYKAVERINQAIEENEKIAVFGDYDADGVTSTAMLYLYLKSREADVVYYIPDRNLEGYGMNLSAIDKIYDMGVRLIITVDNGISAFEEAERIKELGMSLVITDHHRASEKIPEAYAVVDPYRLDCENSSFHDWAGVGVVYKLLEALEDCDSDELLSEYSDLAAIGTVGDVVPLVSENRQIVKSGVRAINNDSRLGITALKNATGLAEKEITSLNIAFMLAPRINAAGRMGSAERALKLLISEDENEAEILAEEINKANSERQQTEAKILEEAEELLRNNPQLIYDRVLVIDGKDWHSGVIGIVAAKMVEKYGKPCLVISKQSDSAAKGSGRSLAGFSLYDALKACEECLVQFGGHTLAAGFEVEEDKIDAFRKAINDYASTLDDICPELVIDCKLNPKYINLDLLEALKTLEPFGAGNKQPIFGLYNMYVDRVEPVSNGKHCKLCVSRNGIQLNVMRFGVSPNRLNFKAGDVIDLAVTVDKNVYLGTVKVSVIAKDIKFSAMNDDLVIGGNFLYEKIKRNENTDSVEALKALPSRDLVGRVYKLLKKYGNWLWDEETLDYRIGDNGEKFCAVKVALDALEELKLIKRDKENCTIEILPVSTKTDLESADILHRLKESI